MLDISIKIVSLQMTGTRGLIHIRLRELKYTIYGAHMLRKQLDAITHRAKYEQLNYNDIMEYRYLNNTIGQLLLAINHYFVEIKDLAVEEDSMTRLYIRYSLWVCRVWIKPLLDVISKYNVATKNNNNKKR